MIMLNAPLVGNRLGYPELSGLDLLELFAFVHPARFAVPTPKGIAHALGLDEPEGDDAAAPFLREAAARLLATLGERLARAGAAPGPRRRRSARLRWPWAPRDRRAAAEARARRALAVLASFPNGRRAAAAPQPRPDPARPRRHRRTGSSGWSARMPSRAQGQRDYAAAAAAVFAPRLVEDQPNLLLAEAGTGIGKTLGYLAPASLWAEQADGAVWISTYTKALQRQLDREGARLFPDPAERKAQDRDPQGPRELSLPAQPRGRAAGRLRRPRRDPRPARRALGRLFEGRRHGRRRPAGLADLAVPPRRRRRPDRPARRMRLCRLPALPALLHRARRPRQPGRRSRHRQPRPCHGQRRARPRRRPAADPDRVRRGPSSVRRRRFDLRRRLHRPGGDRAAPLDRRPGRQDARPAPRPRGAADGRRLL